jgi:hypothetical protein
MLVKIARTQMRGVVVKLLKDQGGLCCLCKEPIDLAIAKEGVIDHDHSTGEVRGVLHRWCNGQLGKVEGAATRAKRGGTMLHWLKNAVDLIENGKSGLMYPSHKTDDEKKAARALKERTRRAQLKVREIMKQKAGIP